MAKFNIQGPVDTKSNQVVAPDTVVRRPFTVQGPQDSKPDRKPESEQAWWEKAGQFGLDALRNFNDTATFGLYNKGLEATGIDTQADEKLAEADERNPWAGVVGDTAGYVLPGLGASSLVSKAVPALAKNTIPRIMGKEAIAAGGVSATDDILRTGQVDPMGVGIDALMGGGISGGVAGLSRLFSPMARVRAAGSELSEADRLAAQLNMDSAADAGIPLTVPEAVNAANPAAGVPVQSIFDDALQSPKGSQVAQTFEATRAPKIAQAGRQIIDDLGPGADPFITQDMAIDALSRNKAMVDNSADPFYKAADSRQLPPSWAKTLMNEPGFPTARDAVADDPDIMAFLNRKWQAQGGSGPVPPHSVLFLDAVKQQMDTVASSAFKNEAGLRGSIFSEGAEAVTNQLDRVSPDYPIAREITERGNDMLSNLEAGPLGRIAKQPTAKGQAGTIFNVDNAVDADLSRRALAQLGAQDPALPRGVLANQIDSSVSKNPSNFAKDALPNPHAQGIAMGVAPDVIGDARFRAAASLDPYNGQSLPGHDGSFLGKIQAAVSNLGKGKIAKAMQDPKTIAKLGKIGPAQSIFTQASTGTATTTRKRKKRKQTIQGSQPPLRIVVDASP